MDSLLLPQKCAIHEITRTITNKAKMENSIFDTVSCVSAARAKSGCDGQITNRGVRVDRSIHCVPLGVPYFLRDLSDFDCVTLDDAGVDATEA